jgi:hypothetical protein
VGRCRPDRGQRRVDQMHGSGSPLLQRAKLGFLEGPLQCIHPRHRTWSCSAAREGVMPWNVLCACQLSMFTARRRAGATNRPWRLSLHLASHARAESHAARESRDGIAAQFLQSARGIGSPIATGYIVQATHSFSWAFGAAGAFLVIGIGSYIFLLREMEPIPEPTCCCVR